MKTKFEVFADSEIFNHVKVARVDDISNKIARSVAKTYLFELKTFLGIDNNYNLNFRKHNSEDQITYDVCEAINIQQLEKRMLFAVSIGFIFTIPMRNTSVIIPITQNFSVELEAFFYQISYFIFNKNTLCNDETKIILDSNYQFPTALLHPLFEDLYTRLLKKPYLPPHL